MRSHEIVEKEAGEVAKFASRCHALTQAIELTEAWTPEDIYFYNTQCPLAMKVTIAVKGAGKTMVDRPIRSRAIAQAIHALLLVDMRENLAADDQKMEDSIRETSSVE